MNNRTPRDDISVETLRQLLRYAPETGKLFWLPRDVSWFADGYHSAEHDQRRWNTCYADKEAFTAVHPHTGGLSGHILSKSFHAARVAWALHHGAWPEGDIDHRDGDRANNRLSNLRVVSHQQNMQNKKIYKNNGSGVHGVSFDKIKKRWQCYITVNKKRRHIGYSRELDAAIAARRAAEVEANCFYENHGRAV